MSIAYLAAAAASAGQLVPPRPPVIITIPTAPVVQAPPARTPPPVYDAFGRWNPGIGYVKGGQNEPGYRSWYLATAQRKAEVKSFNDYLALYQVSGVIPTWQLIRTASSWSDCYSQPFEVPPQTAWPNIVQTLRYIRDYVVPAIGPVEAVSAYRNPALNKCAGGAPESAHKYYSAIDMVPLRPTTREDLMRTLCLIHATTGENYHAGLGFYAFLRFHIDTMKFRRWGTDPKVTGGCPPIVRPGDETSVGAPFPQPPLTTPSAISLPPATVPATVPPAVVIPPAPPPLPQDQPPSGAPQPEPKVAPPPVAPPVEPPVEPIPR